MQKQGVIATMDVICGSTIKVAARGDIELWRGVDAF